MNFGRERVTRRGIQVVLGCLWLLDGLLQLQPKMFTRAFATQVIAPSALGQPWPISPFMHWFMGVFLLAPGLFNAAVVITEVTLGALILWRATAKVGLVLSVGWALFVWIVGEGLGGLLSGHALLLMGSPGAAVIYAILALGVLPEKGKNGNARIAYFVLLSWVVIWVLGAVFQVLPGQNQASEIRAMVVANEAGVPGWVSRVDEETALVLERMGSGNSATSMAGMPGMRNDTPTASSNGSRESGFGWLVLFAVIQTLVGIGVLFRGTRTWTVVFGSILALFYWIVGQSFGGVFTGLATDPGTAPLLILLGLATIGCIEYDLGTTKFAASFEKMLVGTPNR